MSDEPPMDTNGQGDATDRQHVDCGADIDKRLA